MLLSIPAGTTSKIIEFLVFDSSSSVGSTLAGLVYNSTTLTAYYNRSGASGAAVAITLADMTKGTWASGGCVAVDGTNMPGWYQLGLPDAAIAAGAVYCSVMLKGATNMVPACFVLELTATSNQDGVRGGMTALPNAAQSASGGIPIKTDLATAPIKKNTALAKFAFTMKSQLSGAPVGGKTVTCTRSIDGGAYAAGTLANVAEQAGAVGTYLVDFGAGDLNGSVISLRATASGCDDTFVTLVPWT